MAKIDEARLAEARVSNRQSKSIPFLIRDDGMLYPNVPLVAKNPRYRPYHGDPKANLQQRLDWLAGVQAPQRRRVVMEPEPFNLSEATADEIVSFALEEFGAALDPDTPIKKLREQCFNLANLPDGGDVDAAPVADEDSAKPRAARSRSQRSSE